MTGLTETKQVEQDETVENSPEIVTHFEIPFLEENGLTKNGEPIEFDGNWVDKVSGPVIQPIVGEAGRPRKIVDSGTHSDHPVRRHSIGHDRVRVGDVTMWALIIPIAAIIVLAIVSAHVSFVCEKDKHGRAQEYENVHMA